MSKTISLLTNNKINVFDTIYNLIKSFVETGTSNYNENILFEKLLEYHYNEAIEFLYNHEEKFIIMINKINWQTYYNFIETLINNHEFDILENKLFKYFCITCGTYPSNIITNFVENKYDNIIHEWLHNQIIKKPIIVNTSYLYLLFNNNLFDIIDLILNDNYRIITLNI